LSRGIECGGWCSKGRKAEDGRINGKYPKKVLIVCNKKKKRRRSYAPAAAPADALKRHLV